MNTVSAYHTMATENHRRSAMEIARNRLMIGVVLFCVAFLVMIGRTIELGVSAPKPRVVTARQVVTVPEVQVARADIVDRNGEILATNLETASLYAVP